MKWISKHIYWMILTVFLGTISIYGLSKTTEEGLHFYVWNERSNAKIEVYTSEDGCSYVFLPSYAEMDQVTVAFSNRKRLVLGNKELANGSTCGAFALNQEYAFQIGNEEGTIQFRKSANLPTLYIDTVSGSMEGVYADKENEESASITLYSAEGFVEYRDGSCILKGRGNSTWRQPKKPFLLKLSDQVELLNMGEDSEWILLANYSDESNLHNKLVFDMADQICEAWTPKCEFVDLYLNGQYNGLYLLAEKVESGVNRIDMDTDAGDFLCSVDFSIRTETLENPFCTEYGRTIAICEPNDLSKEAKLRIIDLVNQQERIILSQEDIVDSQLVDIDSWVRKYLIDEIAGNTDADLSSSYFYYSDGVFHGGPVWDYDIAFGNTIQNHYPKALIAKNYTKYEDFVSVYYSALFDNVSFVKRLTEIYENEFLPVLNKMIDHDIQNTAEQIAVAETLNRIRWPIQTEDPITDPWGRYVNTADAIIRYVSEKTKMLSGMLIDGVPYCTVQFEHPATYHYWAVSVPRGSILANTDVVDEPLYEEVHGITWYIDGTDDMFVPDEPILEDMVLRRERR